MKLRLITIAHSGEAGNRGFESTVDALATEFFWNGRHKETRDFVNDCLLCVISKSGNRIPRPLSTTLYATKPGQILLFDYPYLGRSSAADKYALALKDDLSGYCWLEPVTAATSENASCVLFRWMHVFTTLDVCVSDQGPHFINETLKSLAEDYRILHKLTVAYAQWVNGTIESLMRTVLAAIRTLLL